MAGGKMRKAKTSDRFFQGAIPFEKSKGRHILKNPSMAEAIVEKTGIKPTDVVLEIGPGTGNLTQKLLEVAKSVVAIEVDPRMVLELNRRFQGTPYSTRLQVFQEDVLKCDLPNFDICVTNMPYHISSSLTFKLLCHRPAFRCAAIIFQREFAMRLVANPGDTLYCRLSVNTQLLARVSHLLTVGRNNFRPPPRIDSFVVRVEPRTPLPPVNFKEWDGLISICFSKKSKTLGRIFSKKCVLSWLEENYITLQALQNSQTGEMEADKVAIDDVGTLASMIEDLSIEEDCDRDDDEIDMEDANTSGGDKSVFKAKVLEVLTHEDFSRKRPAKLSQVDFLYLLSLFNKAGIRFS